MLKIIDEPGFLREWKKLEKKHYDYSKIRRVVLMLASRERLPPSYRDHAIGGEWRGFRECHIEPNWLLIYFLTEDSVVLARTGTHDDLF
ncbi:MAG: type II toxin-antitoxin system YafQ family toxin [Rickettsiales bacterium]|jgi:mRNA interferase YafQ|nr:type II toxin-antitoxin system YafQ family toxin [Rickettsiales bacterium]